MTWNLNLAAKNATIVDFIININNQVSFVIPMMVFILWIFMGMASYAAVESRTGRGDLPLSFIAATLITVIVVTILSIVPGMINRETIVTVIALSIISVIWYLTSSRA